MERYTVAVIPSESGSEPRFQLLLPYSPSSTVATFSEEIRQRAAKRVASLSERHFVLRLTNEDGAILDGDDLLSHVILSPSNDIIFATLQSGDEQHFDRAMNTVSAFCLT